MKEEERAMRGMLFSPHDPELMEMKKRGHRLSAAFNALDEDETEKRNDILRELLGGLGKRTNFLGPIRFHYGKHTRIGSDCFINFNFTVQDDGAVVIGDRCNFGPNVTIVTPGHPLLAEERRKVLCNDGVERVLCYAETVSIGDDCWFGANVTVCPGVSVGDRCVIGAGSVITKDIPPDSLAAGVPARVIRKITEADRISRQFPDFR